MTAPGRVAVGSKWEPPEDSEAKTWESDERFGPRNLQAIEFFSVKFGFDDEALCELGGKQTGLSERFSGLANRIELDARANGNLQEVMFPV
jgi:hypothetical protein